VSVSASLSCHRAKRTLASLPLLGDCTDVICLLSAVGAYLVTIDSAPLVGGLRIFVISSIAVFAVGCSWQCHFSVCLVVT
jgi:hypothetical protein